MSGDVEIGRFHHAEPLEAAKAALGAAGIPFRVSDDTLTLDVAMVGRGSNATAILMVPAASKIAARQILLEEARKEVADAPPDGSHQLFSYSDSELRDVVKNSKEWSDYDVAVAEYLLKERGVASPPPTPFELPPEPEPVLLAKSDANEVAPGTREVSRTMLLGGYVFGTLLFGIWGFVIAISVYFSTERDDRGRRSFVYDEPSRRKALVLFVYCVLFVCLVANVYFYVGRKLR